MIWIKEKHRGRPPLDAQILPHCLYQKCRVFDSFRSSAVKRSIRLYSTRRCKTTCQKIFDSGPRGIDVMQGLVISLDVEQSVNTTTGHWDTYDVGNDSGQTGNDSASSLVEFFYFPLAMTIPEAIVTAVFLSVIMLGTLIGNVLVILSVFTYRPLRNAQNMFIVSLAAADITVAMFVMPFNVAYSIMGRWIFGLHACEMWLTCDVLCCTASILNLCAIALDRYWAIHDPIRYGQKRTLNRVLTMIALVWVASALISIPPLVGWNDWPETFDHTTPCKLTEERGYIIYSSSGSFFIPLITMTIVYIKIFEATKRRLRQRAKAAASLAGAKQKDFQMQRLSSDKTKPEQEGSSGSTVPEGKDGNTCTDNGSNSPTTRLSISIQDDGVSCAENLGANSHGQTGNFSVNLFVQQRQKISLSKERRAARILGIVMGVFVICWLPFFLMYVILPFCGSCYISDQWINFITWLGYMNSALNPVIYTVFNLDFRKAFTRLLCGSR